MNVFTSVATPPEEAVKPDPDWWRGAVIYQIYPRSFQDSNGDGIGDLTGIRQRLPYIANLGADAIWISPFFTSPMKDFGYDVSDYYGVDHMFGSLEDFRVLVEDAHALGLKVMIDLVISHTSDQHPWFAESRSGQENSKADWYVWADPKPDGSPPNNWLSIFGGSAWEWDTSRRQYYMHNFLASQPDLNFHNPQVQDELLAVVRFWLELGVDGFRLDTINFYFHAESLQDNPALAPEGRNASIAPDVNPYNYQDHLYDKSQPENLKFLERFRAVLDEFPAAAAVGEVGDAQRGTEIVAQYTAGERRIHMCYSFDFLSPEPLSAAKIRAVVEAFEKVAPDGWSCWAFSNHDVVRHASRWGAFERDPDRYLKIVTAILLTLRGSVCLYQGEELGLPEADIAYEDLQDPYGIRFWPKFKGRDGCRTPMVWASNLPNGGFSTEKPWLPVPDIHRAMAVDTQQGRDDSVFEFYRDFLEFRRAYPVFAKGSISFLDTPEDVVAYIREFEGDRILCVFNLTHGPVEFAPGVEAEPMQASRLNGRFEGKTLKLEALGGFVGRIQ
ncbi:alpha-glucosidase family protein [Oricola cellulosilytica]|uniref:Alpha-glucosidase n=1 Tax=Oricola cellulosilytica TaxID=1429082 RepID=A0A4R0PI82_9HYPH|nr:alpha-glucosidase family protein [Oricola cellulosilytica]TCD16444.1 alpha-glucosidase [Oricola cellulosilytica]